MKSITAQFLHQHNDKVIYEQIIIQDSPRLECHHGKVYFAFEIPIAFPCSKELQVRWIQSGRYSRLTKRSMRFLSEDSRILYELTERRFKVKLDLNNRKYDFWVVSFLCNVEDEEIGGLAKIFSE